jgi:hypothetical protein
MRSWTLPYSEVATYVRWGDAYYSIALALNVLLTLMLITRLALHSKNIRSVMGTQDGASGLYKTIITMLVESGALYAASFVLLVGSWAGQSLIELVTFQIVPETQVRVCFSTPLARLDPRMFLLTMMTNSASLHLSSSFGWPTGPR